MHILTESTCRELDSIMTTTNSALTEQYSPSYSPSSNDSWSTTERRTAPRGHWCTSSQYADVILSMTGHHRSMTDLAGEWHSLLARVRHALISSRKDQAEQQIAKLDGMRGESEGWDGRQATAPDAVTIDLAAALLRRFAEVGLSIPVATISPSGNAALFGHGRGIYADIELHADKTVSWLVQLPHGPELEDTEPFDGKSNSLRLINILRHAPGSVA